MWLAMGWATTRPSKSATKAAASPVRKSASTRCSMAVSRSSSSWVITAWPKSVSATSGRARTAPQGKRLAQGRPAAAAEIIAQRARPVVQVLELDDVVERGSRLS